jgi:hypothetical protein
MKERIKHMIYEIKTFVYHTVGGQLSQKKRPRLTKTLKIMADFLKKTKEEIKKVDSNFAIGGAFIAIGLGYIPIYPIFAETCKIKETTENQILFFGAIMLSIILGLMLMKYPERLARREDFYDDEEEKIKENLTNDIKTIVEISGKSKIGLEDKISEIIFNKYKNEIEKTKIRFFDKPLNEKNSLIWHVSDKICENKYIFLLIGVLMFIKLIYNVS